MKRSSYEACKKIRRTWTISPVEQIIPDKRKKSRQAQKLEIKKASELF